MVPEGRRLFPSLSVEENLLMGAYAKRAGRGSRHSLRVVSDPEERRSSAATGIVRGQQQMAAIGRALMSNPGCSFATNSRWALRELS